MTRPTRREFLHAVPALLFAPTLITETRSAPVRLLLIYAPEFERAKRAAEMSAAEVQRAATLLKREFSFRALPISDAKWLDTEATAVIAATNKPLDTPDIPLVDISGSIKCSRLVLTLTPPAPQSSSPPVHVWHESLNRYGAAQLNDRFKAAGITPDEQAWLGWFAVKLLWEAGVRGRAPSELSYDGHKGMALRFNAAGVLLQPVYVIDGDEVVREIRPSASEEHTPCAP